MLDFPSVRVAGAIDVARARVLIVQDTPESGTLRIFTKKGLVSEFDVVGQIRRVSGWRRTWAINSTRGELRLTSKCQTCGGWRVVTRPTAEDLWDSA